MVNDLVNAISKKIKSVISEDAIIRLDKLDQALEPKPFFFIKLLNSTEKEKVGAHMVRHNFVVSFFPKDLNAENAELLNQGAEALMNAFRKLTLADGRLKKGLNRHAEISDGVLHVFFSVDLMLWELEESRKVKRLEVERKVKDGK